MVVNSRLAIQQCMGVFACKQDTFQAMLVHHKELVVRLNFVRYLHIIRCYNAAVDTMATDALEVKLGQVLEAQV